MQILKTSLAVTRHEIKKVRFSRYQFRGRWYDRTHIVKQTEERPAAYIINGKVICHPTLYAKLQSEMMLNANDFATYQMPPFYRRAHVYAEEPRPLRWSYDLPFGIDSILGDTEVT